MSNEALLAAVELGGSKCICVLATGPADIRERKTIATGRPDDTLPEIERTLANWQSRYAIAAVGIASFGPVDIEPQSPTFGCIRATPKPHWSGADVRDRISRSLGVPIGFNTDVNAAALAERRWGNARGSDDVAYITVGTGVGVGLIVAGRPVSGIGHPELGHIRIARPAGDTWAGSCPFHGDCVEGLVSGPAIAARTGIPAPRVPPDHIVWDSVAHTLGQLLHVLVLATAPERIILGGGVVSGRPHLIAAAREQLLGSLNGYVRLPDADAGLLRYIQPAGLGDLAGAMGALALAIEAAGTGDGS